VSAAVVETVREIDRRERKQSPENIGLTLQARRGLAIIRSCALTVVFIASMLVGSTAPAFAEGFIDFYLGRGRHA